MMNLLKHTVLEGQNCPTNENPETKTSPRTSAFVDKILDLNLYLSLRKLKLLYRSFRPKRPVNIQIIWFLVGGFNPFEKYESNWIIFPGRGGQGFCCWQVRTSPHNQKKHTFP